MLITTKCKLLQIRDGNYFFGSDFNCVGGAEPLRCSVSLQWTLDLMCEKVQGVSSLPFSLFSSFFSSTILWSHLCDSLFPSWVAHYLSERVTSSVLNPIYNRGGRRFRSQSCSHRPSSHPTFIVHLPRSLPSTLTI